MTNCSTFYLLRPLIGIALLAGCTNQAKVPVPQELQVSHGEPEPIHPYRNSKCTHRNSIHPLKEVIRFPERFAQDLDELRQRASLLSSYTYDMTTEGFKVRYYPACNHSHHGLLEHGVRELPYKPGPNTYFAEHWFDQNDRLIKVISNTKSGDRFLSHVFAYEEGQPSASLTFRDGVLQSGTYGMYHDGHLSLVVRFDRAGDVRFCICIYYTGGIEDSSIFYVV